MRYVVVLSLLAALAVPVAAGAAKSTVTISAQPRAVVYGSSTTLSGGVAPAKANVQVHVLSQTCSAGHLPALAPTQVLETVSTQPDGAWSTTASPVAITAYAAKANGDTSATIRVGVRPQVTLIRIAPHRYRTVVLAAQSFAGAKASFQRFRPALQVWKTLRHVTLKASSTPAAAPTLASGATFRSGVRAGARVRLVLPQSQVGACYLAGRSAAIRS
jgi:hypothetical protein